MLVAEIVTSISIEHLRTLLRQRGVRWHRTKTWRESHDPDFDHKYRAIRRLCGYVSRHKKAADFLRSLRWVWRRCSPGRRLHIMLDSCGTHLSSVMSRWAATRNVRLYFTPTNASWLNRIETYFGPLKKFALNNSDHRSHVEQKTAIRSYLLWRNRRHDFTIRPPPKTRNRAA